MGCRGSEDRGGPREPQGRFLDTAWPSPGQPASGILILELRKAGRWQGWGPFIRRCRSSEIQQACSWEFFPSLRLTVLGWCGLVGDLQRDTVDSWHGRLWIQEAPCTTPAQGWAQNPASLSSTSLRRLQRGSSNTQANSVGCQQESCGCLPGAQARTFTTFLQKDH